MSRTRERYARMMATFWRNPRVRKLTDAAIATYCLALSYACDQLNDGFLAADDALVMCARGKRAAIKELVAAGFWLDHGGTYEIANYLEHNESREELDAARERAIRDGKRGGRPKGSGAKNQKGTLSENGNGTHAENETHGDGDGELTPPPPPRGSEAEGPRPDLEAQIAGLLANGPVTPASTWRLLELLTALESGPDPDRRVVIGMASAADLGRMAKVLEAARRDAPSRETTPLRMVAEEWSSLLALVNDGHIQAPRAPAPYFQKLFGQLATRHAEAAE
jgi:hypothetical protein